MDVHPAPGDDAAQARTGPDKGIVLKNAPFDRRVPQHPYVGPEHRVRAEVDTAFDHAFGADHGRTLDHGVGRDVAPLADPHPIGHLEARDSKLNHLVEHVGVGAQVRLERADVLPVAGGHGTVERPPVGQQCREHLAAEVHRATRLDVVEHGWLEHIDARVDRVREHLAPRWLLEEALDRAVVASNNDPELERVVHRGEGDRRHCTLVLVVLNNCRQVDVGDHVARDHDEAVIFEEIHRIAHAARRPEGYRFVHVGDAHAEVAAVPEVLLDGVRHERNGHHDVLDAVVAQQVDDVFHHRPVRYREQRLGRR
ncbi:unannotated protein [freshwater metagenome]|uniref:Unannotated protein n=1 Tax=freshwater metagenome TaxID=449393 RepID=A0A6J6YJV2_9ZZZZ